MNRNLRFSKFLFNLIDDFSLDSISLCIKDVQSKSESQFRVPTTHSAHSQTQTNKEL